MEAIVANIGPAEREKDTLPRGSNIFLSMLASRPGPIDLTLASNSLLRDFALSSVHMVNIQLLTLLPQKSNLLSRAANDLVTICAIRALTGIWHNNGKILDVEDARTYILEKWKWSGVWKSGFRKTFRDIVAARKKELEDGMKDLLPMVVDVRQLVWPACEEPLQDDQTLEFITKHWSTEFLVAKCSEGADQEGTAS